MAVDAQGAPGLVQQHLYRSCKALSIVRKWLVIKMNATHVDLHRRVRIARQRKPRFKKENKPSTNFDVGAVKKTALYNYL